jgi:hypothetical protein
LDYCAKTLFTIQHFFGNMASYKQDTQVSKYFFRRRLPSDRNANISMASNGQMIFLSNWEQLPNGKTVRDKQRSIFFNLERWKTLCFYWEDLTAGVTKARDGEYIDLKLHLGGNLHAAVSSEYGRVDIRFWYVPENGTELKAGKPGISITFQEWFNLEKLVHELNTELDLQTVDACLVDLIHESQKTAMRCKECHPPDRLNMDTSDSVMKERRNPPQEGFSGAQNTELSEPGLGKNATITRKAEASDYRVKPYYNPRNGDYNPKDKFNDTRSFYGY